MKTRIHQIAATLVILLITTPAIANRIDAERLDAALEQAGPNRSEIARAVADQLGDPGDVLQGWMEERGGADRETGRPAALEEAERRGLAVPQGEVTELERVWDDLAYRFSATFGFRYGWTTEQIAAGALAALSNPAQNVNLSRSELSTYRSLIDARYPINVPGTPQVMQP